MLHYATCISYAAVMQHNSIYPGLQIMSRSYHGIRFIGKQLIFNWKSVTWWYVRQNIFEIQTNYVMVTNKYFALKRVIQNNLSRGLKEKCYNTVILITSVAIFHFYHIRHKRQSQSVIKAKQVIILVHWCLLDQRTVQRIKASSPLLFSFFEVLFF